MTYSIADSDIAIVGMACRLPGAPNTQTFWDNLVEGKEALQELSDDQLRGSGVSDRLINNPNYVKAGMFLKNMKSFDAKFFGFNPQEAKIMDPQHRHFLECAWECFEDAGYVPDQVEGAVGVFAGSGHNAYLPYNLLTNKQLLDEPGFFLLRHTGNDKDFLSTRVSYLFDLKGPSINVQTACSTSLVAVHMAAQSLLNGECDMALAGGVTIELPHEQGYLFKDSEILSPDGHCRPFEKSSGGTVFGSGVGCVILKRYEDALADGDNIHAVIKSSAINNDGSEKVSYLAPSVDGQAAAISEAITLANVEPSSISFIECHGTGTQMGDPIEVAALSQAYGHNDQAACALGSVKSNIGHLDTAAGVAGLIKTVMCLKEQTLVPTLHYAEANPAIDFAQSRFYVNDKTAQWQREGLSEGQRGEQPLRAAVSSLGVGGTNAHVVLEEVPKFDDTDDSQHQTHVITLSAKTEPALLRSIKALRAHLDKKADLALPDLAYTLNVGRKPFEKRATFLVSTPQELIEELSSDVNVEDAQDNAETVFMFPGGGAQYIDMGLNLYQEEAIYRDAFDDCMKCLPSEHAEQLLSLLFNAESSKEANEALQQPRFSLTALFATEYALAKTLMHWGLTPKAMLGHSMGENTAACLAGVFSLNDAMNLVLLRGRLFEQAPQGGMLSVPMSEEDLRRYVGGELDIAAANSPDLSVVSGDKTKLDELAEKLESDNIETTRVRINVAAHSRMLDGILEEFRSYLSSIKLSVPSIPFTSNLSGAWITDEQAVDPEYWVQHLRNTVRFADNVNTLLHDGLNVFVEVGPGTTLTNLVKANLSQSLPVISTMRHPRESASDVKFAKQAFARVWSAGSSIDWTQYWSEELRFRISLPTYAFDKKEYWIEPGNVAVEEDKELTKIADVSQWYSKLSWKQTEVDLSDSDTEADFDAVVFTNDSIFSQDLEGHLNIAMSNGEGRRYKASIGTGFSKQGDDNYCLNPSFESDFYKLSEACLEQSDKPLHIYYLWSLEAGSHSLGAKSGNGTNASYDAYFWGLFNVLKAIGQLDREVRLCIVSDRLYSLVDEPISALASLSLGPALVAPRELPNVSTFVVDIRPDSANSSELAAQMACEMSMGKPSKQLIYRGNKRWERYIEPCLVADSDSGSEIKFQGKTALITGGLGGIGLNIAKSLHERGVTRVLLMSRGDFPSENEWESLKAQLSTESSLKSKIEVLTDLKTLGLEAVLIKADVTNLGSIEGALKSAHITKSEIDIVIHAAGSMDDKLLLEKSKEEAEAVLSAKVVGAQVLDQLFEGEHLSLFVVFSSVASYLGLPGQVDYTAANAYLDAFAEQRSRTAPGKTLAVNWSAWREVGMAVSAGSGNKDYVSVAGSRLDRDLASTKEKAEYKAEFSVEDDWLIREHKTADGFYLLPGTAYIELFRSAVQDCWQIESSSGIAITNLEFLAPFDVRDLQARALNIEVSANENGASIIAYAESEELLIATAEAQLVKASVSDKVIDIPAVQNQVTSHLELSNGFMPQSFMHFGPRWGCIQAIGLSEKQALVTCGLEDSYSSDFDTYHYHPALLDMATGAAQSICDGHDESDFYIPLGYQKIMFSGDMPSKFTSVVRLVRQEDAANKILTFDIDLVATDGCVFATIEAYRMMKIESKFVSSLPDAQIDNEKTPEQERLESILREAILPKEGREAFTKLITSPLSANQYTIASIDTNLWLEQLNTQFSASDDEVSIFAEPEHNPDADKDIQAIEAILLEHRAIEKVVVRSFLDEQHDRRLIAFYQVDDWEPVTITELRAFAQQSIPEELQPKQLVQVDGFELLRSGEIDRTLLIDPLAPVDNFIAPKTSTEKRLAKIWQGVLGVNRVALNENFFDLGGHSLLSIRVIVKVKKELGVRLDQAKMVLLTLEQMAKEIDDQLGVEPVSDDEKTVELADNKATKAAAEVASKKDEGKRGLFSKLFKMGNS